MHDGARLHGCRAIHSGSAGFEGSPVRHWMPVRMVGWLREEAAVTVAHPPYLHNGGAKSSGVSSQTVHRGVLASDAVVIPCRA